MRRLKVVQYVGEYYLLTDWIVEGSIEKRVWISNTRRQNAVVILNGDPIKIVLSAPDGTVVDVNATRSRLEALRIAREMLTTFYAESKTIVTKSAPAFRDWLDL